MEYFYTFHMFFDIILCTCWAYEPNYLRDSRLSKIDK